MGISEKPFWGANGIWLAYVGIGVILYSALMTGIYMLTVLVRVYCPVLRQRGEELSHGETCDPGWKMLVPLVVFAGMILLLGMRPAPLLEFLYKIGGEAG